MPHSLHFFVCPVVWSYMYIQAYDPNDTKEAQPAARGCVPSIDRLEYVDCSLFVSCSNKLVADNGKGVQKCRHRVLQPPAAAGVPLSAWFVCFRTSTISHQPERFAVNEVKHSGNNPHSPEVYPYRWKQPISRSGSVIIQFLEINWKWKMLLTWPSHLWAELLD